MSRGWIAVMVLSGTETAVADKVRSLGIESYCPMHSTWRRLPRHLQRKRGKSRELAVVPMFPRYIFAHVDGDAAASAVLRVRGVTGLVRTENGLCYADPSDIERMQASEASEAGKVGQGAKAPIRLQDFLGKTIEMASGPLNGLQGVVSEATDTSLGLDTALGRVQVNRGKFKLVTKDDRDPDLH